MNHDIAAIRQIKAERNLARADRRSHVIGSTSTMKVGDTDRILGEFVERVAPGLWKVAGVECVGINDVLTAFDCR